MASRGKLTGGIGWREVVLNKDKAGIGDRCSVFLAQDATSANVWRILIYALTDQGALCMGEFHTTQLGLANELPSRLVAVADCPGAIGWKISAHCEDHHERADAWIASSPLVAGGANPGITVIRSGTSNPSSLRTFLNLTGVQVSPPISGRGATVWDLTGTMSEAAVAGAQTFVMVFDQAVAPVLGDIPIWTSHLGQTLVGAALSGPPDPSIYRWTPPTGYPVVSVLWVATSTTPDTYTPDVAHTVSVHLTQSTPN
jgi:hypothetical protein